MRTKSRNRVSVDHAIDLYYQKHKKELLKVFRTERSAKAHMKYDAAGMPSSYFKTHKQANQVLNDWYDNNVDPNGAQLRQAKRDAVNREIWADQRMLNKKMNANEFKYSVKGLGINTEGADQYLIGYYEIKGQDMVLANIRNRIGNGTEYETWEYRDVNIKGEII